ncbi:hypothetical protein CNR22_17745 [Sphingobacteriaceae bacterium]|nr:hypothetical protein CNR22_17745 [Sphingobacteriaceae bacterium]
MKKRLLVFACTCLFLTYCHNSVTSEADVSLSSDSLTVSNSSPESTEEDSDSSAFEFARPYSAPEKKLRNLSDVNRQLRRRSSVFVIKTNRDTVIKCKQGTLLSIPANAFLNATTQKPVNGQVKISIKEFYTISDMLVAGLTTTSNKRLLESGGMININVISKETKDSCILKPGKNISMAMPPNGASSVDGMQLFNGSHDSSEINWVPRNGIAGLAQYWSRRQSDLPPYMAPLNSLVFPEGTYKLKPAVINTEPENLQAEMSISLRDLMQYVGVVTRKAFGYIDTLGNLQCYNVGGSSQQITFKTIYSPTRYKDMKVNLSVDVTLNFKSYLNHEYYQKLFKLHKGNPDSMVTVGVVLNPSIKLTSFEKIKSYYQDALTVTEFRKKQKYRSQLQVEYDKKLAQLRLADEERLLNSEKNASSDLQSAQEYLLLSTPKLGWINCDRFYSAPSKVDYMVNLKEKASLLIVFKAMKSILSSNSLGVFHGVPLNAPITLVALKIQEGKLMMALHETTVTQQPFDALDFKTVSVKEYKEKLEKLNRL